MTQPNEAVGGEANNPVETTATEAFEQMAEEWLGPDEEEPEEALEEEGEQPEAVEGEEAEDETDEEAEVPPIDAPVSWDAEAKEVFASLPREAQEIVAKREAEREKFVQSKAQEAKSARVEAEKQALEAIQNVQAQNIQALNALKVQLPAKPSPRLQADDPWAYAEQAEAYENALAHNHWIEQQADQARQMAQHAEQDMQRISLQETEALLREQFPEYLDPEKGPELKRKLASTALALGYTEDQLANVDGRDILAMRLATEKFEKADKYDKLMAQQMEKVRAGKKLPPVSKPGVPQAADERRAGRAQAAWEATKNSRGQARNDAFADYLTSQGLL